MKSAYYVVASSYNTIYGGGKSIKEAVKDAVGNIGGVDAASELTDAVVYRVKSSDLAKRIEDDGDEVTPDVDWDDDVIWLGEFTEALSSPSLRMWLELD